LLCFKFFSHVKLSSLNNFHVSIIMIALILESFNVNTIMQSMKTYLTHLQTQVTDNIWIHQHLVFFQEAIQKINYLESLESADERVNQQQCITIFVIIKNLLILKELMLMISDTKEATRMTNQSFLWHCICMLRDEFTLWIYNLIVDLNTMSSKQRINEITKLIMIKTLWIYCNKNKIIIHNVRILEIIDEQNQCLSLVCLWMKDMILKERLKWSNLKNCANFDWREIIKWWLQDCLVCFCWIQLCLHVL